MRRGLQKSDSLVEHIVKSACDSRVSCLGRSNAHVCKVPPTQRKTRRCIDPTAPPVQDYIVFTYDDYQSGQANPPYPTPPNHIVSIREERFKLAEYYDVHHVAPSQWEMYDPLTDPLEVHNIAYGPRTRRQQQEFERLQAK